MAGRAWTVVRSLLLILGMVAWVILLAFGTAHAEPDPGRCAFQVDEGVLRVVGDGEANVIHITDGDDGVQVTCDGAVDTFADLVEIVVEAGEGDDEVVVDNSNLGLTMTIKILGQGGNDSIIAAEPGNLSGTTAQSVGPKLIDGGPGEDVFTLVASPRGDRVEMAPGAADGTFELKVTDIETEARVAEISGAAVEEVTVKLGDGDDEFLIENSSGGLKEIEITVLGQGGSDLVEITEIERILGYIFGSFLGGPSDDTFILVGNNAAENVTVTEAPDIAEPDPHIRVTDRATGIVTGDFFVQQTEEIRVEAGGGDDEIVLDNSTGGLNETAVTVLGQSGNDEVTVFATLPDEDSLSNEEEYMYDGGPGEDAFTLVAGPRAERFEMAPSAGEGAFELKVTDIETELRMADISGAAVEEVTVKLGDGDDEAVLDNSGFGFAMSIHILGQGGNDINIARELDEQVTCSAGTTAEPAGPILFDGGPGEDTLMLVGSGDPEKIEFGGVPDQPVPDPHIRVTNLATGRVTADLFVQQTETIHVEACGGDDQLEVAWDPALMSGLETLKAVLGRGDDRLDVNLLTVTEAPDGVQPVALEVEGEGGDDEIAVTHNAGSWIDLAITADLGSGDDRFVGLLTSPPADALPGPEGVRDVSFEVIAGDGDDAVIVRNQTSELFDFGANAVLGDGEDLLEARGEMNLLSEPGRGFDTARVTRNLLRFVSLFELVELLN